MIGITIDTQGLLDDFNLSKEEVDSLIDFTVKEMTGLFAADLEQEANQRLHSTRQTYKDSILIVDEGRMKGAVILSYSQPIVRMIEEGASAFDMKENFAKSDKKKTKKNGSGWYLTVPQKVGTPNALNDTLGFNIIMPKEVYNVVKKQETTQKLGTQSKGIRSELLPEQFREKRERPAFTSTQTSKTFEAYKNKSSIFTGIIKKKDSVTGQSSYMSFRRVSDKSDPSSWIHPGMNERDLFSKALSEFETKFEDRMKSIINTSIGF